jgi:hypothetical protein
MRSSESNFGALKLDRYLVGIFNARCLSEALAAVIVSSVSSTKILGAFRRPKRSMLFFSLSKEGANQ